MNPEYRKWYYEKNEAPTKLFRSGSIEAKEFFSNNLRAVRGTESAIKKRVDAIRKSEKIKEVCRRIMIPGLGMRMHPEKFSMNAGANHIGAKVWSVRDPNGRKYRFKNLNHFIRSNPYLFEDGDADWVKNGNHYECRARGGLKSIKPSVKKKSLNGSWKGWVWVTLYERALNNAVDPMDRIA